MLVAQLSDPHIFARGKLMEGVVDTAANLSLALASLKDLAPTPDFVVLTGEWCEPFEEAVAAPRLHVERLKDRFRVLYEPEIDGSLLGARWELRPFQEKHMYFGAVKLTGIDSNGKLKAVADPRRHGEAIVTKF